MLFCIDQSLVDDVMQLPLVIDSPRLELLFLLLPSIGITRKVSKL